MLSLYNKGLTALSLYILLLAAFKAIFKIKLEVDISTSSIMFKLAVSIPLLLSSNLIHDPDNLERLATFPA